MPQECCRRALFNFETIGNPLETLIELSGGMYSFTGSKYRHFSHTRLVLMLLPPRSLGVLTLVGLREIWFLRTDEFSVPSMISRRCMQFFFSVFRCMTSSWGLRGFVFVFLPLLPKYLFKIS